MQKFLPYLIPFLFTCCLPLQVYSQDQNSPTGSYSTACDSYPINKLLEVKLVTESTHRKIFTEKALVYCTPDVDSRVIDTLFFTAPVHLLEQISRYRQDSLFLTDEGSNKKRFYQMGYKTLGQWYKIERPNQPGYISLETVAQDDLEYFGLLSGYVNQKNDRAIALHSFAKNKPAKIRYKYVFKDLSHGYDLKINGFNGLQNSGQLIVYKTFGESCPGAIWYEFVALKHDGFTRLISSFSTGEAGEFEEETIYLPLKFKNGKVLLVANADLENIFNYETGSLKTYPYPAHLKVPITQLIVRTREYTEAILGNNGEPVMDKDDTYKVKVIKEKPRFYKWDGVRLSEIK